MKEALPSYDYIGVGRDDGKEKGEHSAIFYRTDKFDVIEKGDFWLSETPDVPSKGWDAVLPRICSWGHFKCKDNRLRIPFLQPAHGPYRQESTRGKCVPRTGQDERTWQRQRASGYPDGRLQRRPDPPVLRRICQQRRPLRFLREVRLPICAQRNFQQLRSEQFYRSRIDHIFVSPSFHVKRYGVLTDTYRSVRENSKKEDVRDCPEEITIKAYEARTPSDHFPVKVELVFDQRQQK